MHLGSSLVDWPWRTFTQVRPLSARKVQIESGQQLIQVCSTQYLGILWSRRAQRAIHSITKSAVAPCWGSFGSNYLGGTHGERLKFENEIAKASGCEAALAFASGWAACYAVGEMLGRASEVVLSDVRSHNSLIHGLRAGNANIRRIDTNNVDLEELLQSISAPNVSLSIPSIEGITGEAGTPKFNKGVRSRILLVTDESHSFGALGRTGTEPLGEWSPDVRIFSLSKAFGTMGGVVCGKREIIDTLSQVASPWTFSTAMPPLIWKINNALLPIVISMHSQRQRILELASEFRHSLADERIQFTGQHHITGLKLPKNCSASALERGLFKDGFFAKVSLYPSRPRTDPCARIAFTPWHTARDVARLVAAILVHR